MREPCMLVKTVLGMERVAAVRIREEAPWLEAEPSPRGFRGLVLVYGCRGSEDAGIIEKRVPEADRVIIVESVVPAMLEKIAGAAAELTKLRIRPEECFAVRTVRRGKHSFTSVDVNVVVGDAVRRATGACVNLSRPDKIVLVEIIGNIAMISVVSGSFEWKKMRPGKKPIYKIMRRIRVVQMPYLGPLEASYKMGVRVGREVQNFEVRELVVAPIGRVEARPLGEFLRGLFEGIESRYEIQRRSYNNRRAWKVPVYVQDLHQFVRDRSGEPIIVLEPEGKPVAEAREELENVFRRPGTVNILAGSREGIPLGVYRFADLVLDIAPGITLSTEYAVSSALIAIASILYPLAEDLSDPGEQDIR